MRQVDRPFHIAVTMEMVHAATHAPDVWGVVHREATWRCPRCGQEAHVTTNIRRERICHGNRVTKPGR